jgi:muramoyltetrapeptide carboxypeptidase
MLFPPPLPGGALVRVVAPSGPFDAQLLRDGLGRLADFEVRIPESMMGRQSGFFAGTDAERLRELQEALDCPETAAILIARGGYGIARLLPHLNFDALLTRPKWLIGFSDATVLHATLSSRGLASVHGPNGTTLARATQAEVLRLQHILAGLPVEDISGLTSWHPGTSTGPLFGGNLTVLFAEAASGRLQIPSGSILFLEDVTETSYRVDRMIEALRAGGHLDRASAIVLGDFHDCSPGKFSVPVEDVLRSSLTSLGVPVLANLPLGHGTRNAPLVCGAQATVNSENGRLKLHTN